MPLLARIIIAILLGVIFGNFNEAAVRAFLTFNGIQPVSGLYDTAYHHSSHHSGKL